MTTPEVLHILACRLQVYAALALTDPVTACAAVERAIADYHADHQGATK